MICQIYNRIFHLTRAKPNCFLNNLLRNGLSGSGEKKQPVNSGIIRQPPPEIQRRRHSMNQPNYKRMACQYLDSLP